MQALETVELKIALADNSETLSKTLDAFLCAVLLKFKDTDPAIRAKVIAIVQHVNQRIKNDSVRLPLAQLVELLCTDASNPLISNFSLLFILHSLESLLSNTAAVDPVSAELLASTASKLAENLGKFTNAQQKQLVLFVVVKCVEKLDRFDAPVSEDLFTLFADFILTEDYAQYKFKDLKEANNARVALLKFLAEESRVTIRDEQRFFLFLLASGSGTGSDVKTAGEDFLKRMNYHLLQSNSYLMTKLIKTYLHTTNHTIQAKILHFMSKSDMAINSYPFSFKILQSALKSPDSKVLLAGIGFSYAFGKNCNQTVFDQTGNELFQTLSWMLKNIQSETDTAKIPAHTASSYENFVGYICDALVEFLRRGAKALNLLGFMKYLFETLQRERSLNLKTTFQKLLLATAARAKELVLTDGAQSVLDLLFDNLSVDNYQIKVCTMEIAAQAFGPTHALSRLIILIFASDMSQEIRKSAFHHLYDFEIDERPRALDVLAAANDYWNKIPKEAYATILNFVRNLLFVQADRQVLKGLEGNDNVDIKDVLVKPGNRALLTSGFGPIAQQLFATLQKVHASSNELQIRYKICECLYDLTLFARDALESSCVGFAKLFLVDSKPETRILVAKLLGIIETSESSCVEYLKNLDMSKPLDVVHGSVLTLAGFLARQLCLGKLMPDVKHAAIEQVVALSLANMKSTNLVLTTALLTALGDIFRFTDLSLYDKHQELMDSIHTIAKTSENRMYIEQCISTLGNIALGQVAFIRPVMETFYSVAETKSKNVDLQLTIGQAAAVALCGWQSTFSLQMLHLMNVDRFNSAADSASRDEIFSGILDELLGHFIQNSKSIAFKKSTAVWLISMVKFTDRHPVIVARLAKLHAVFSALLSDKDEFVQEIASKGISLVYAQGDEALKSELVRSLMGSFSGDAVRLKDVTAETALFEPGALGTAPDGTSVSTYKELCSLASELNKPELMYKFMNLASNNHMWNTRKGAAFGFASIVGDARDELQQLPDLIPKLYRYSFDPNSKVSESMRNIWNTLVLNTKEALDKNFSAIMTDLVNGMGDRQWRIREASCAAMTDFLSGRDAGDILPYLEKLWNTVFRCLDDIKESVRVVAFATCKSLINMTVKYCGTTSSDGQRVTDIVVPYLLQKGIISSVEEVRKFSLNALLEICKQGGTWISGHTPDIICTLIEAMSGMEPQVLNYLSFHVGDDSNAQLDAARARGAGSSPMMEAVELCTVFINEENYKILVPKIVELVRRTIGVPSKAGTSRFITYMCIKIPNVVRSDEALTDSLLKGLSGAVQDRSVALRKAFAASAGYLIKHTSKKAALNFMSHLKNLYCTQEDQQEAVSVCFLEISKHSSDIIKHYAADVLPFVFFAMHDAKPLVQEQFQVVWEACTGSKELALKLYKQELIQIIASNIKSQQWNLKIQAALTLADLSVALKESMESELDTVAPLIYEGMAGRTWKGKDKLLEAFCTMATHSKNYFLNDKNQPQFKQTILKECKKKDEIYKRQAIEHLSKFLSECPEADWFQDVWDACLEWADLKSIDECESGAAAFNVLRASSLKAIAVAWRRNTRDDNGLESVVNLLVKHLDMSEPWNVKLAVCMAIEKLLPVCKASLQTPQIVKVIDGLFYALQDGKFASVREAAVANLKEWIPVALTSTRETCAHLAAQLKTAIEAEKSVNISVVLAELLNLVSQ